MSKNQVYILVGGGCLVALCVVVAMLVGTLYIAPKIADQLNPVVKVATAESSTDFKANGNSLGDPNAPIHIIEFGDFQCPFCKRFHVETESSLISTYVKTGKVYFTQDAALAAYCAGDQNKFWEMHDALFANNRDVEDQGSFTSEQLTTIAKSVGLDMTAYQDCFDSGKYANQVKQDYADTLAAGIQGTPSFAVIYTVNGVTKHTLIEGAQPFDAFQQAINEILNELGLTS